MTLSHPRWMRPAAIAAAIFGLLTIASGSLVLFGPVSAQRAAGDTLSFVVIFNTVAGFAYLIGAVALWQRHPAARGIALAIGLATLVVFLVFATMALTGSRVELRTALALPFRAGFWLVIAWAAGRHRRAA